MDGGVMGKSTMDGGSATHFKGWRKKFRVDGLCDWLVFMGGVVSALFLVWALWRVGSSNYTMETLKTEGNPVTHKCQGSNSGETSYSGVGDWDKGPENFYNDPQVGYTIGKTIKGWDMKRKMWLEQHPHAKNYAKSRVLLVTGSQATPCKNPIGDNLLLRSFKNKMDYCRRHGVDIFYNTVLLEEHMYTFWSKIPLVRAAMVAHPEAEWIWWMDADAVITDMDFELPLESYENYNMVLHGWKHLVYEKRSWTSINAGIFLMRNCEWSMEFMERWASMGPQTPQFDASSELLSDTLPDRAFKDSDDQSAIVYLLLKEKEKWGDKIFLENLYNLNGYWVEIVGSYEDIENIYKAAEKEHPILNQRHAEKMSREYAEMRKLYMGFDKKAVSMGQAEMNKRRRPFVTHFAGCQPCSGNHNKIYSSENCWKGMERALNFADNQVLRNYGFKHDNLSSNHVTPISSFYIPF
ncbi:hypothetical protein SUGI_0901610 [Cryptomeria japonica]|uniref:galactomannan galactosyltransferase 1 n=1 Tax=Cryptomeria japonica TaxID=3369 RepID=UPI002414B58E|nr:galactomannan galactosyltransferase 1 [Cryptomeria japonica]GLJ43389.1 hypothetical protein SUGI_0901610 [Cryptomeria japonica]